MFAIPPGLVRATSEREGEAGEAWLRRLPRTTARFLERWDCEIDGDPWHGEVALVVPVRRAEGSAALKISFPHLGNRSEGPALRRFDGRGAIRLFEADDDDFALLLERAGRRTLDSVSDVDRAIEIAGVLARRLAVPADPAAPVLADTTGPWEEQLEQQVRATPSLVTADVVDRARDTIRALGSDTTTTMLHGDLHFGNILESDREPWLAIDPKGWRGTAAYDAFTVVAASRKSLIGTPDLERAIRGRIERFAAAADVDAEQAVACTQARATSSYVYQHLQSGSWFDQAFLRAATELRPGP